MKEPLGRFLEGIPTHNQVRHKENEKMLPSCPGGGVTFNEPGCDKKHRGHYDLDEAAVALFFLMVVVMMMLVTALMVLTVAVTVVIVVLFVVHVALAVIVIAVVMLFVAVTVVVVVLFVGFVVHVALTVVVCMMKFFHIWCVCLMQRYWKVSATRLQMSRGQRRRRSHAEVSQVCKKRQTCDVILLLRPICVAGDAKNTDLRRNEPPPATKTPLTCNGTTSAEVSGQ